MQRNLEPLDIQPVALGSASAHLAAAAALRLRNEVGWVTDSLILVYPSARFRMPEPSQSLKDIQPEMLPVMTISPDFQREMAVNYIGDNAYPASPYATPRDADPTGLGPTLVLKADYDDRRPRGSL